MYIGEAFDILFKWNYWTLKSKVLRRLHSETLTHNIKKIIRLSGMMTSPWEDASCKGSPSSLSKIEEETQEEVPGAEPQFLLHKCEMPRML